jgi:hypothetical protein
MFLKNEAKDFDMNLPPFIHKNTWSNMGGFTGGGGGGG